MRKATLAVIHSVALLGLEAVPIQVEVDVGLAEKPCMIMVGLPDTAVRESKERVLTALKNSGFAVSGMCAIVNLAPGDLRKEGPLYDLPIALGMLGAMGLVPAEAFSQDLMVVGELGLGGETRSINGALAIAMMARQLGKKKLLIPAANAPEAAAVSGIEIIPITSLKAAAQFLQDPSSCPAAQATLSEVLFSCATPAIDFADIRGQTHVKRAMEIVAAGGHNALMLGPPGSGKTMIAKAMVGILPQLSAEEALEITKIHSISGLLPEGQSIVTQRPFRAPHHTISYAGLIGGGVIPRPGEVALAHHGVLFLDELPEFPRAVLEVLRQPLEDRKVTISRANGNFTFPTSFMCIAAMNPCPCGLLGHPDKPCRDSPLQIERYRGKISGPLLDRIDLHIDVPALRYRDLLDTEVAESSLKIRSRVCLARERQSKRLGVGRTNALLTSAELRHFCPLDEECRVVLRQAIDVMGISARACDRLLRVARTIADLAEEPQIRRMHLMEALAFRSSTLEKPLGPTFNLT